LKKPKCSICQKSKARRLCRIKGDSYICSLCCAEIRDDNCIPCTYYEQSKKYNTEKQQKSETKKFIAEINPEIDEEVDDALQMLKNGNIEACEKMLRPIYEKNPDLHSVQYAMGTLYAFKNNYTESIKFFDNAIKIFPYYIDAWFNKAISHQRMLQSGEYVQALRKVVEYGATDDIYVIQANEMLEGLDKALEPGVSMDNYLKGMELFENAFVYMENKKWEKAIDAFKRVLNINPKHPQSYGNMGLCYAFLGEKQKALSALDKALELDPDYKPAIINQLKISTLREGEKLQDVMVKEVRFYKDEASEK
jgi:tetratricopeptide (TPR) repeat protein